MLVALVFIAFVIGAVAIMRWQGHARMNFYGSWAVWTVYAALGLILLFAVRDQLTLKTLIGSTVIAPLPAALLSYRSFRATFHKPKTPTS